MRQSGILLSISSLPSNYGIGTLGKAAYDFVDFLKNSGQKNWQVLPLGPTSYGDSPYASFSTFAGNPYFIDLDMLIKDNLLTQSDVSERNWGENSNSVSYDKIFHNRFEVLRKAYENGYSRDLSKVMLFREKNRIWIEEYALFMALKNHFELKSWQDFDEDIKMRKIESIQKYQELLSEDINFYIYLQYLFFEQWKQLKEYANSNGIKIIGDIPIYVALDSADCWGNSQIFLLNDDRSPKVVAGCPPDGFSPDGQLWGNPCYDWDRCEQEGFSWWIERVKACSELYDVIRIDHFRGFESFYAVEATEETARNGRWIKGPGMKLFNAIKESLGEIDIIAEDLGFITPEVEALLKATGFPGMKIMQFGFDPYGENQYIPHNYTTNSVVYPGTHDNETTLGWSRNISNECRDYCKRYLNISDSESFTWGIIRGGMASVSYLCIVAMQDYLELDNFARMNTPSSFGTNWTWRLLSENLSHHLATRIDELTKRYRR